MKVQVEKISFPYVLLRDENGQRFAVVYGNSIDVERKCTGIFRKREVYVLDVDGKEIKLPADTSYVLLVSPRELDPELKKKYTHYVLTKMKEDDGGEKLKIIGAGMVGFGILKALYGDPYGLLISAGGVSLIGLGSVDITKAELLYLTTEILKTEAYRRIDL